jgi:hypothetical protein
VISLGGSQGNPFDQRHIFRGEKMSQIVGHIPADTPKKNCDVCSAWMPKSAIKCTKCDSFQGWRRSASLSSTTLALLTALVSVLATTYPLFRSAVEENKSDIVVDYGGDDDQGGVFLLVANSGARPGQIAKVTLAVTKSGTQKNYVAQLAPDNLPTVLPNASGRIRYWIDVGNDMDGVQLSTVSDCKLVVTVFGFVSESTSNKAAPKEIKLDCSSFRPLGLTPT